MKKQFVIGFSLFIIPLLLAGCNPSTQNTQIQDIVELKWQADGSALFGFMQNYIATGTSVIPATGYNIVKFNSDGSLAQTFTTTPKARPDFSNSLYISADGSAAVTQLENDLYRYTIKTGVLEKLDSLIHLIVVSPDLHYAVSTTSPNIQPIKTIRLYDISVSPIQLIKYFDISADAKPGIWLNNGMFGITVVDSVGRHIAIYDITGTLRDSIGGAETAFHNVVFNSASNDLFVRNWAGKTTDQQVDKINLDSKTRANVLNFKVENFDVTRDESAIIYSAYDTLHTIHMRSRNLLTSNERAIADDIRLIIALSPLQDKLAYIRQRDANFTEVHVIPFIKP